MSTDVRRQRMVIELRRAGRLRTADLSRTFGVSEVTVRADLAALARQGLALRIHGGAAAAEARVGADPFEARMRRHADAKQRIAAVAARMIGAEQSLVFDSGSTLLYLALRMPPVTRLVVATTALNIAQQLMAQPGIDVHMIGGRVDTSTASTVGSDIEQRLDGFVAHQAFVSAHAIDRALDVVDCSHDVARTKRNLVRLARRVVLLADSSKWDVDAASKAFPISAVDVVVTDDAMPDAVRGRLDAAGVEVHYA